MKIFDLLELIKDDNFGEDKRSCHIIIREIFIYRNLR